MTNPANEYKKVTEIELDTAISPKSEEILNTPANEWREAPEEVRSKCRAICNEDTTDDEGDVFIYRIKAINTAIDIAYQAGLDQHSAHLVARVTKQINPLEMAEGWERWWKHIGDGRYVEHCTECDNTDRIIQAIDIVKITK
jgi:hypothetical protein